MLQIRKRFRFEAAHVLPHHPGKCARPHGHSYRVEVALEGVPASGGPAAGMVMDFDELGSVVENLVIAELDHRSLNEILPNPTAELIAIWIWRRLAPELSRLAEVVVWETASSCAVVRNP